MPCLLGKAPPQPRPSQQPLTILFMLDVQQVCLSQIGNCWGQSGLCSAPPHPMTLFPGKTLMKVSEAEKRLGAAERDFIHTASLSFLTPLRNFLEGDWKTISVRSLGSLL